MSFYWEENARALLLALQCASIAGLFAESWIVFSRLKKAPIAYLFLSCVATLLACVGYLFQLLSTNQEAYITALIFSYSGRAWITFFLFLFTFEFCKIKIPSPVKNILTACQMAIYFSIMTLTRHRLYYTWFSFSTDKIFPRLSHGNGIVHHIFMTLQVLYIVIGFTCLFVALKKQKNAAEKKRILIVIVALLIERAFFAIRMFKLLAITEIFDVTTIGYFLGMLAMLIAFFRYDLLGAKEIARDFIIDRISEAIIATDTKGNVQYFNKPAGELFPSLENGDSGAVKEIQEAIASGSSLSLNKRIYTAEESDLTRNDKVLGKLYALVDSTEHYERFRKEKNILQMEIRLDPMTGLYNRKGMEHFSESVCKEALESGKALLLCICDMNGLKNINDNYGHKEGDLAIKKIAQIIKNSIEEKDMAFRLGGDEFLILGLRENCARAKAAFRKKIESAIKAANKDSGLPYSVDMSYGPLVQKLTGAPNEFSDMMKSSDELMYEMKKKRDKHIRLPLITLN